MDFWIIGAGGVGRETLDACVAAGVTVAGFRDEGLAGREVRGLAVLGLDKTTDGALYLLGIAEPAARRRLSRVLGTHGWQPATVVHPRAALAPDGSLGAGSLLLSNAYISSSVSIGRHCQIHYNATVGHDAVLADFVTVYPGANVSGAVNLEEGVTVGSNAVVLQGRTVGRGAFVGAGAVVTRDVRPGSVVAGSPARPLD